MPPCFPHILAAFALFVKQSLLISKQRWKVLSPIRRYAERDEFLSFLDWHAHACLCSETSVIDAKVPCNAGLNHGQAE